MIKLKESFESEVKQKKNRSSSCSMTGISRWTKTNERFALRLVVNRSVGLVLTCTKKKTNNSHKFCFKVLTFDLNYVNLTTGKPGEKIDHRTFESRTSSAVFLLFFSNYYKLFSIFFIRHFFLQIFYSRK